MIITRQPVSTDPLLVGETASFSCEAESDPASNITWFRVEGDSNVQLVDNGADVNIMSEVTGNTTSSDLTVLVEGAESFTQYFCEADNGPVSETSNMVVLVQAGNT